MPQIKYSNRSQIDLRRLFTFLAEKDQGVANHAIKEIHESLSTLSLMPEIGRPIQDELRELIIDFGSSGYIALYEFDEILDEIIVYAIKHQRENDYKTPIE
jgi:plasmid stabilization system protein ParE